LSQNLKLSKQLESVTVSHRDELTRLETRIQELTSELTLAAETRTRLETQCEKSRQRAALDADEQSAKIQQELQVRFLDLLSKLCFMILCNMCQRCYIHRYIQAVPTVILLHVLVF